MIPETLSNVISLNAQLKEITNLPANAVPVQQAAMLVTVTGITALQTIQQDIGGFAVQAITTLMNDLNLLNSGDTASAKTDTSTVSQNATLLKGAISTPIADLLNAPAQFAGLQNTLNTIHANFQTQISTVQLQLQNDQAQVDYWNKRKMYFLALGPLGVEGLAVTIGKLAAANPTAQQCSAQVAALNTQAAALNTLITVVTNLRLAFSNAYGTISGVNNALDAFIGDAQVSINDIFNTDIAQALTYIYMILNEAQDLQNIAW